MFIAIHTQLRKHRRTVTTGLAVLAATALLMTAHSALMGNVGDQMTSTATVCLAVGGCTAVIGVALFAIRRVRQRPFWLIPAPVLPELRVVSPRAKYLVRAGPPPLLQVFRL